MGTSHPAVFAFIFKCSIYGDVLRAGHMTQEMHDRLVAVAQQTLDTALAGA